MRRAQRLSIGRLRDASLNAPNLRHGLGNIEAPETIAAGPGICEIARLRKRYGRGRWRKRKGCAEVRLTDGTVANVELHWYEAT